MNLEARETARLYTLLTDKLGRDITEAMFKYIDNKTERSVEATIKTLATKEDMVQVRFDLSRDISNVNTDLRKEIAESKADSIKWMFIFWVGQMAATLAILVMLLKK